MTKTGKNADSDQPLKPMRAALWIVGLVVSALLFYLIGQVLSERQALQESWNASDRLGLMGLEGMIPSAQSNGPSAFEPLIRVEQSLVAQLGKETPDGAAALNRMANLYALQGDYASAESAYRKVRAVLIEHLGSEHPDVAVVDQNLRTLEVHQSKRTVVPPTENTNTPLTAPVPIATPQEP
ncbi:MAG: tetratricopeptide repeat protein [Verrucomicrobia bacterium]|jgi:hypothetical protein|nr:tetratricopeptide repeat protein [Verrucomicrobiota bacterium]